MADEYPDVDFSDLGTPEEVETPKAEPEKHQVDQRLVDTLGNIDKGMQQNQTLVSLLSIPEVQQVLEARRSGKPIKVSLENDQPMPVPNEPEPDWEQMKDDPRKMVETMVKMVVKDLSGTVNNKIGEVIGKELNPMKAVLDQLNNEVSSHRTTKINTELQEVRKEFSDYDQMLPQMVELNKSTNGSMTPRELYILAKIRSGSDPMKDRAVESEKPSGPATRAIATPKKQYPLTRQGYRKAIEDAYEAFEV